MASVYAANIIPLYCSTHARLLTLAEKVTEAQLFWRPTPAGHSIAFLLMIECLVGLQTGSGTASV